MVTYNNVFHDSFLIAVLRLMVRLSKVNRYSLCSTYAGANRPLCQFSLLVTMSQEHRKIANGCPEYISSVVRVSPCTYYLDIAPI